MKALDKLSVNSTVIELFEIQVQKTPYLIAVQDKNSHYSYKELNEKANQFAHWLINKNINSQDFVAILLEPSVDFIICILAVIKIGAVYTPLDTMAPKLRLETLINDLKPKIIITSDDHKALLHHGNTFSLIKNIQLECASRSKENLQKVVGANSPIYLMYTSGSTGTPKGILIPHSAVVNLVTVDNYAGIHQGIVIAQFSNLAFDASTFEIWSALLNGGLLSIIPIFIRTDNNLLKTYLQDSQVTCLFLPTSYFHQLIKSFPETLNSVALIVLGGEQINPTLVKKFLDYRKVNNNSITLINGYGPTEATTFTCRHLITEKSNFDNEEWMSIGEPIRHVKTYLLDEDGNQVSEGELCISGINLALGYYPDENKNQEQFISNPFEHEFPYKRIYKTGDRVKLLPSGKLLYLGRLDDQVKIGGFRVHLHEVENELMKHEAISFAAVVVEMGGGTHRMLTAYLVFSAKESLISADAIRAFLSLRIPPYMLPNKYIAVDELPLTSIGKIDKKNLDKLPHTDLCFHVDTSSSSTTEETIKTIWEYLLNRSEIDVHKNLFELGATSLLMMDACPRINRELKTELQISELLTYPTIYRLSRFIEDDLDLPPVRKPHEVSSSDIAVIGMSCRFPNANSIEEFWNNLCQGTICFERFSEHEIARMDNQLQDGQFVPVRGILSDIEQFDANFFGFSPTDASITDPQQRLFLECTWEALEQASVVPSQVGAKTISVFAGMADSTYLHKNLLKNSWVQQELDWFQQRIASSVGMLSTQVSYRLNLKGRSLNINTACSTGLVTVAQACQELVSGTSDIAVAGSVSIVVPQVGGYIYKQGNIESPDGHCHPFENRAQGTVFSNGVGVVVLKRLEDALVDNNTIYAVIKGVGVNNDGSDKLGYTVPSVEGQKACIREALMHAKVKASELGYVEGHGTATALGDVVEVEALSAIYREETDKKHYCALGSVKANIGHTDVAAGISGFIKTVLCLFHKKIPPMPNFESPNIHIHLEESPFFINSHVIDWQNESGKRYAGVSAFGVGGTNVHVVLSESIQTPALVETSSRYLMVFSAKTEKALQQTKENFTRFLERSNPSFDLADIAYTLQTGREAFQWRSFSIGCNTHEIINNLSVSQASFWDRSACPGIIFMFPGQGMQYHHMASQLMEQIPYFSSLVQRGVMLAKLHLDLDLLDIINNPSDERLHQTQYAQPALFIIEYALAKLLMHYGLMPDALIGHNLGEYVAACLAGVFSFEEAIALVCQRGFLLTNVSFSDMLAKEIEKPFKNLFSNVTLSAPQIPLISNVTGTWLSAKEATESNYWYQHLCHPVQFCKGVETILEDHHSFFIEVGPGQSLNAFLKEIAQHHTKKIVSTHSFSTHSSQNDEVKQVLAVVGMAWQQGIPIHWQTVYEKTSRRYVPLPTYPFQKQRYWVESDDRYMGQQKQIPKIYIPVWSHQQAYVKPVSLVAESLIDYSWIIFNDEQGLGEQLIALLKYHNIKPIVVIPSETFAKENSRVFKLNLKEKDHYLKLFQEIKNNIKNPIILHLASYSDLCPDIPSTTDIDEQLTLGFYSLLYLTQAYIEAIGNQISLKIAVVTCGTQQVLGTEKINPVNAALNGSCRVIMQEYEAVKFRLIDLDSKEQPQDNMNLLNKIIESCMHDEWNEASLIVPYRNGHQWRLMYTTTHCQSQKMKRLKDNGVYLLTGGIGGIALSCCEAIAKTISNPTFILLSRSKVPSEVEWQNILQNQDHHYYKKMKQVRHLQASGATFLFYQVDISHAQSLNEVIQQCIARFGTINGLIHAAGISHAQLVESQSRVIAQDVFLPKLHGTYNLINALKGLSLDFVVIKSSLAALLGGFGQIDYSGANACLDAFAYSKLLSFCTFVVSINWNTWRDVGMAAEAALKGGPTFLGKGNDISSRQGQELFLKILAGNEVHVAVSNSDINVDITPCGPDVFNLVLTGIKTPRHDLNVITPYIAPSNEIELKLVELWQDMLGIDKIGITDDFFALGGHSLKAASLIEKINKIFHCRLAATQIYKDPTIRQLYPTVMNGAEYK